MEHISGTKLIYGAEQKHAGVAVRYEAIGWSQPRLQDRLWSLTQNRLICCRYPRLKQTLLWCWYQDHKSPTIGARRYRQRRKDYDQRQGTQGWLSCVCTRDWANDITIVLPLERQWRFTGDSDYWYISCRESVTRNCTGRCCRRIDNDDQGLENSGESSRSH